jgi:hypothetical protein
VFFSKYILLPENLEGEKRECPSVAIMVPDVQDSCLNHNAFGRVLGGLKKIVHLKRIGGISTTVTAG